MVEPALFASPPRGPYARILRRFLAHFLDGLAVLILDVVAGFAIGIALGIMLFATMGYHGGHTSTIKLISDLIGYPLCICIGWLYDALFIASELQATPGKLICGIQVTDLNGQRLSFARASGRHFAKWISSLTLLIGYLMAAFTTKKQALHDLIAGTLVVKKN